MTSSYTPYSLRIHQLLEQALPQPSTFKLYEAMHYCVFNGGKRLRPLLVYVTGEMLNIPLTQLDSLACAIELIHSYSLVHDDLPAMDNAALRRGQPSCHKKYDEATAILVGDALLTLAFEVIALSPHLTSDQKASSIQHLATHSGACGMIKGQALDLDATYKHLSIQELTELCHHKTGQLLIACIQLPLLLTQSSETEIKKLNYFAECLGLAYQLQDDLLDIESETNILGKQVGIDKKNQKNTFPDIIGIPATKQKLLDLKNETFSILESLPFNTHSLESLTLSIFNREA